MGMDLFEIDRAKRQIFKLSRSSARHASFANLPLSSTLNGRGKRRGYIGSSREDQEIGIEEEHVSTIPFKDYTTKITPLR